MILELVVCNFWHIQPTLCCCSSGYHIHNSFQLTFTRIKENVKNVKSKQLIPLSNAVQIWYDVNTLCHVLQSYSEFVDIRIIHFECFKYIFYQNWILSKKNYKIKVKLPWNQSMCVTQTKIMETNKLFWTVHKRIRSQCKSVRVAQKQYYYF